MDPVKQLMEMGGKAWSRQRCVDALKRANGKIEYAAEILFNSPEPEPRARAAPAQASRASKPRSRVEQPHHQSRERTDPPAYDSSPLPKGLPRGARPIRNPSELAVDRRSNPNTISNPNTRNYDRSDDSSSSLRLHSPPSPEREPRAYDRSPPSTGLPHKAASHRQSGSPPPFIPHMGQDAACKLRVGQLIDHRDDVGKSLPSKIQAKTKDGKFVVHYDGWAPKWDTECDPKEEYWRFSEHKTLSQRQCYTPELNALQTGDYIDINPRKHPGWKGGTIRRMDICKKSGQRSSGQVQVQYRAEATGKQKNKVKEYLYWVHLDNGEEVAPFPTKSQGVPSREPEVPEEPEKIAHNYSKDEWIEVKDAAGEWEPASIISVEGNVIRVHYENWSSKWDENIHVVRDAARIRSLGGAIPESEAEKIKREELELAKKKLKEAGLDLVPMEEDGNCLYRAWAYQIYGDANKHHMQVRKECCDYIEREKEFFSFYIPEFEEEMKKKRTKAEWGDHIDIMAMAELYNCPVKIYQLDFAAKQLTQMEFLTDKDFGLPVVMLARHRQKHYNAVKSDQEPLPIDAKKRKGNQLKKMREDLEKLEKKSNSEEDQKDESVPDEMLAPSRYPSMTRLSHSHSRSRNFVSRFSTSKPVTPTSSRSPPESK